MQRQENNFFGKLYLQFFLVFRLYVWPSCQKVSSQGGYRHVSRARQNPKILIQVMRSGIHIPKLVMALTLKMHHADRNCFVFFKGDVLLFSCMYGTFTCMQII